MLPRRCFSPEKALSPIILEQEEFPRFHIGESMTGEAGACFAGLGSRKQMTDRRVSG